MKSATTGMSVGSFSFLLVLNWVTRAPVAVPVKDVADVTDAPPVDIITSGSRQSSMCASVSPGNYSPTQKSFRNSVTSISEINELIVSDRINSFGFSFWMPFHFHLSSDSFANIRSIAISSIGGNDL